MVEKPYEKLKFYKDICEIRRLIYQITEKFDKRNLKLISQMRDAARSAKQNIREGYSRGSLAEFIRGIRISQGSLEELSGDVDDCFEDKLITVFEYEELKILFRSASFMSNQYLKSMAKTENKSQWKVIGKGNII
jgi:four helix bundle protein